MADYLYQRLKETNIRTAQSEQRLVRRGIKSQSWENGNLNV